MKYFASVYKNKYCFYVLQAKLENEKETNVLMDKLFQSQTANKRCQCQLEEANNQITVLKKFVLCHTLFIYNLFNLKFISL